MQLRRLYDGVDDARRRRTGWRPDHELVDGGQILGVRRCPNGDQPRVVAELRKLGLMLLLLLLLLLLMTGC